MSDAREPPVDIASLLAPLHGLGGAGEDLRYDPAYAAIREARREDNARLPQGIWAREVKRADWKLVERLCVDILRVRSKDLQVASWLVEAMVRQGGFPGLAPGLRLLGALCLRFWPALHPTTEDGELGPRIAPFEWLNARMPVLLRDLPVVRAPGSPETVFTWTDHVNAQLLEALRQRDAKSVERSEAAGAVSLAAFTAARSRTEIAFWQRMHDALLAARAALVELDATLGRECGRDAPGLNAIAAVVTELANFAGQALADHAPVQTRAGPRELAPTPLPPVVWAGPASPPPATREDIYARIAELAAQLLRIEPHSPAPYLLRRAVAWSELSLAELAQSFSDAGLDVGSVFALLGVTRTADPDTGDDT